LIRIKCGDPANPLVDCALLHFAGMGQRPLPEPMSHPAPTLPDVSAQLPAVGESLLDWRIAEILPEGAMIRLLLRQPAGQSVQFRLARPGPGVRSGPFDLPGLSITYGQTPLTYQELMPLGQLLMARLLRVTSQPRKIPQLWRRRLAAQMLAPIDFLVRVPADEAVDLPLLAALDSEVIAHVTLAVAPGAQARAVDLQKTLNARGFGQVTLAEMRQHEQAEPLADGALEVPALQLQEIAVQRADDRLPWQERARQHLRDKPHLSLRLGQLVDPSALPDWPCTLPWTRLEVSQGGQIGPCCVEYQATTFAAAPKLATALWNGPGMQAFRRAMLPSQGTPSTCRATCPVLVGQSQRAGDVRLRGGPTAALDSQIALIEDMLAGRTEVRGSPLAVCLATTSYCNYDCLMCPCGEEGKLSDQLPAAFYDDLQTLLPGMQLLEANGGEPLASPTFRDFLTTLDAVKLPQLQVNLVTNGSYLAPKLLDKLERVPFGNITLSLNAATPASYLLVNRGLPYERVRAHLDDLLARQKAGMHGELTYSMVILKQNVSEIEAFADLALADDVHLRYMLPFRNRHESSVLTDRPAMLLALQALQRVASRLLDLGRGHEARDAMTSARILLGRLDAKLLKPL
jgi:molybdenum cofactor biosynthesis enzyme MoaA